MTQAPVELGNTAAYQKKLMGLLGDRDPIEVLGKTADLLASIVHHSDTAKLQTRPYEGKWTPCEILGHLCDAEWIFGHRIRQILSEDVPQIVGIDQDLWVAAQRYNEREPGQLVEQFRHLRSFNLHLWKMMKPADLERTGKHNERGPEALGTMLKMHAGHDLSHIDQISRYLDAVG